MRLVRVVRHFSAALSRSTLAAGAGFSWRQELPSAEADSGLNGGSDAGLKARTISHNNN